MGRRGPKPQPTVLKLARGNPGKRAINHDEPDLPPADLDAPRGLRGRALEEWRRLGPTLLSSGVLTEGDRVAFQVYCELVAGKEKWQKLVNRVGLVTAQKLGYCKQLMQTQAQLRQQSAELGLTPSSRSGVRTVKPTIPQASPKAKFFGAGRSA